MVCGCQGRLRRRTVVPKIQRTVEQQPFSFEEKQKLAQLSKCLSSVAATCRALGFAATNAALDAFEVSETAVLLFDRLGRVARINRSAEFLFSTAISMCLGKGLSSRIGGRLARWTTRSKNYFGAERLRFLGTHYIDEIWSTATHRLFDEAVISCRQRIRALPGADGPHRSGQAMAPSRTSVTNSIRIDARRSEARGQDLGRCQT